MMNLSQFRDNLRQLLNPEVLRHMADFLEATGSQDDNNMLARYKWFCENGENGPDCRYAVMAKEFFLRDQASDAAKALNWLYHNWSKHYE
jgi:erythromycin esterase-like protein